MGNISINTTAYAKHLLPGIKVISAQVMGEEFKNSAADRLFTDQTTTRINPDVLTSNTMGLYEEFQGTINYGTNEEGYYGSFTNVEYTNGVAVQRKFLVTDQYPNMWMSKAKELGLSYAKSVENLSMGVFRNADNTTTLTLPDTKALVATDHPSHFGITQSNKGTTALSPAALEAIRIAGKRFKTERGDPMYINFDTIIIPPELEPTIERIVGTVKGGQTLGAVEAINVEYKRWNVIVSEYLTDTNNYYVVDSSRMKNFLFRNWVVKNEITACEDFDTKAAKWAGYFFFGFEIADWRWIYGGIVS